MKRGKKKRQTANARRRGTEKRGGMLEESRGKNEYGRNRESLGSCGLAKRGEEEEEETTTGEREIVSGD